MATIENEPAPETPPPPEPVPALPTFSPHILHSSVAVREATIKLDAYRLGILTLEGELEGAERVARSAMAKIDGDADERIAKINEERQEALARIQRDLDETRTTLSRRLDDLQATVEMYQGMVDVHAKNNPPQETQDAQAERPEAASGDAAGADRT